MSSREWRDFYLRVEFRIAIAVIKQVMEEDEAHVHLYDLLANPRNLTLPEGSILSHVRPSDAEESASRQMKASVDFATLFRLVSVAPQNAEEASRCGIVATSAPLHLLNLSCKMEAEKLLHRVCSDILENSNDDKSHVTPLQIKQLTFALENPAVLQFPEAHLLTVLLADFVARTYSAGGSKPVDGCYLPNDEIKLLRLGSLVETPPCPRDQLVSIEPLVAPHLWMSDIGVGIDQVRLEKGEVLYSRPQWLAEAHKVGSGAVPFLTHPDPTGRLIAGDGSANAAFKVVRPGGLKVLDLRSEGARAVVSTYLALRDEKAVPQEGLWPTDAVLHMSFFLSQLLPYCSLQHDGDAALPCGWIVNSSVSPGLDVVYVLDGEAAGEQIVSWMRARAQRKDHRAFSAEEYARLHGQNGTGGLLLG